MSSKHRSDRECSQGGCGRTGRIYRHRGRKVCDGFTVGVTAWDGFARKQTDAMGASGIRRPAQQRRKRGCGEVAEYRGRENAERAVGPQWGRMCEVRVIAPR